MVQTEVPSKGHTRTAVFSSLESPISVGGGSLSAGQKQLVALARAMMRCASVVLTDEATSAIDLELDDQVSFILDATKDRQG
jgi:ABC-type bacteriocin/lantibiotic exporter with double-glycine peptidase domain